MGPVCWLSPVVQVNFCEGGLGSCCCPSPVVSGYQCRPVYYFGGKAPREVPPSARHAGPPAVPRGHANGLVVVVGGTVWCRPGPQSCGAHPHAAPPPLANPLWRGRVCHPVHGAGVFFLMERKGSGPFADRSAVTRPSLCIPAKLPLCPLWRRRWAAGRHLVSVVVPAPPPTRPRPSC